MKARSAMLAAVAAGFFLGAGTGVSHADPADPGPYLDGNGTAWFNLGGTNCSITSGGVVGCDINPAGVYMSVTWGGTTIPVPYVPAAVIDNPGLPGHPAWTESGSFTLPGGNQPLPYDSTSGMWDINYAGASCEFMPRGGWACRFMGHEIAGNSSGYVGN